MVQLQLVTESCLEKPSLFAGHQITLQEWNAGSGMAAWETLPRSWDMIQKPLPKTLNFSTGHSLPQTTDLCLSHSLFIANKKELLLLPYVKSSSHQKNDICPQYRQKQGVSLTKASRKTWQVLDSLVTTHSLELFNGLAILQARDQGINFSWHNTARGQPAKQQGSNQKVRSQHTEIEEFTSLTGTLPQPKPQPAQTSGTSESGEISTAPGYRTTRTEQFREISETQRLFGKCTSCLRQPTASIHWQRCPLPACHSQPVGEGHEKDWMLFIPEKKALLHSRVV